MSLTSGPSNVLPRVQVLAGFGATSASFPWTDISQYVRSGNINRSTNRLAGPLYQYQAGTLTLNLKDADARFDPDNLDGPYVTTVGLQPVTKRFTPQNLSGGGTGNSGPPVSQVTGTFTVPPNLNGTSISVQCWAAGAGGGSGSNISAAFGGGGGGGGEYAAEMALQVVPGSTYSFAIGLGGAGGVPGASTGGVGGDTTFSGTSVVVHAHGGQGGTHGVTSGTGGNGNQGTGGLGGTGSANTTSNPGGAGGPAGQNSKGTQASGGGGGGSGGPGGGSGFIGSGGGAVGGTGNGTGPTAGGTAVTGGGPGGTGGGPKQNGAAPTSPPGGGGGGGAGDENGGSGAQGQIIVTYTLVVAASARTEVLPSVPIRVIAGYALNQTINFENGIGVWTPQGAGTTIAADSTQSLWGQSAALMTAPGVASPGMNSEAIPLQGLSPWSFSAWAFCPAGWANGAVISIRWLDSSQSLISQVNSTAVALATGTWTPLTFYNLTPPGTAVYARVQVHASGTPANGTKFWFDQICAAPGPAAAMFPLFTGYVNQWNDTGIVNPVDIGAPTTGPYAGYSEIQLQASDAFGIFAQVTLAQLTTPIDGGDDCGGRIALALSSIGWPASQQILQTSPTKCSGALFGDTILDIIQTAANTDGGDLFVDGLGNVVFNNRQNILRAAGSTSPQAVFGDRPGTVEPDGIELPYAAVVRANDDTTLFNDIQITPVNNSNDPFSPPGTLEEVSDPVSIAQFLFERTYQNSSLIMEFQADALNLAQLILFVAKNSEDRIDQLTIDPQRDPADLYYQALGRQFTDMIEFWRRPPGMIVPIVKRLYVRAVQHQWDFSAKTWQTAWTLQDANKYGGFLRLDDVNAGRLDYAAVAY